ncbi:type II toxin-antitoxin system RatA family toxin [Magnetovibrio blakemorei]|uniref:Coenzyme Q-binding protein COQ10 START domain-containing protein n=1 Tax=Magnetovibrio blakemorei TaxID=28181 RepID=A0A1E5QBJ1_9PROT|nr:type II toxin-antitoxin system RatA family toxin [Magnetovibrio blakemorei]OEJ69402.1 hypothetical protein BEN30_03050 [Magnetovibrio blakemorei]
MASYSETRRLEGLSAEQMFDLVLDVAKYPEFLPWCVATRVKSRSETEMVADMAVGFKMLREKYTSHVHWDRPHHIHIKDAGGPFKFLETDWLFRDTEGGCEIDFRIDFEFRSALLESVMGRIFTEAAHKMMAAFVTRAKDIYLI